MVQFLKSYNQEPSYHNYSIARSEEMLNIGVVACGGSII